MSTPQKRSISLQGHRTSLSLEPIFWAELQAIAARRGVSMAALIAEIDAIRTHNLAGNLSSALRVFVVEALQKEARP